MPHGGAFLLETKIPMKKNFIVILSLLALGSYITLEKATYAEGIFPSSPSIETTLLSSVPQLPNAKPALKRTVAAIATVWVTAYSSTPEETDDTPFITAANTPVRDGVIAANFLPFGTKVKIPSLFGDKIFVVEDRMHPRKTNNVDIWMSTKDEALQFGAHKTEIAVLN